MLTFGKPLVKRAYHKLLKSIRPPEKWPKPDVKLIEEPHFLFIITPAYSGSTALARILNTSARSITLTPNAEGQTLVPGWWAPGRWSPDRVIDWDSVRAVWLQRYNYLRKFTGPIDLVIEKSPSSLVRVDQLIKCFPSHSLMAFNRNPFGTCSSLLHRHHSAEDLAAFTDDERMEIVARQANFWLQCAGYLRKWLDDDTLNIPYFTYEQFCADPAACLAMLTPLEPSLATVDVNAEFRVKDYPLAKLSDQNARQIARLKPREIDAISKRLKTDPELVARMGYDPERSAEI
jgi:hypothetical protein